MDISKIQAIKLLDAAQDQISDKDDEWWFSICELLNLTDDDDDYPTFMDVMKALEEVSQRNVDVIDLDRHPFPDAFRERGLKLYG